VIVAGAVASDALVDAARLTTFLASVTELKPALPIRSVERLAGGQSNVTCRVELADRSVILRRPPPGPLPPRAHDVLREFRVMSALWRDGRVPVPHPIAACEDPAVLGAPFFLMEALDGEAVRFQLPPNLASAPDAVRRSMGEQVAHALADLHATDPAAIGLADFGRPSGYVPRQIARWRSQLDFSRERDCSALDRAANWLDRRLPPEPERASVVHGDYRLDNTIFATRPPARLLGVVDWELSTIGDPLADLGWLLAFWREPGDDPPELPIMPTVTELPGFPTRREMVELYSSRRGHPVGRVGYYVVFAMWRMAVLLEGHWARHVRGTSGGFDFAYLETAGPTFWWRIERTIADVDEGRAP
jgi:aminoglycoside phosphotransferase (APT) family kinase protein